MAKLEQWAVEEAWLQPACELGEAPFYEAAGHSVRFVDLKKKRLHSVQLGGAGATAVDAVRTRQLDVCASVTADIEGVDPRERIVVGVKHGVALLHRPTGTWEMLARFREHDDERLRSNDGAVDPHGRLWLGSMTDFPYGEVQAEGREGAYIDESMDAGSLFRFSRSRREAEVLTHLGIPNGIGWSPDHGTMYFTHTTARQIIAWDYDPTTGAISTDHRLFYQHETAGEPDGLRVDVHGNLWIAVYGEGCVLKIGPDGSLRGRVSLPTRNVTCVQFVGTELIITSAVDEAVDAEPQSRALGGALFKVDVGTRGMEPFKFRL